MKKINITDITLKKLCESREVALLFREKTAIASCADSIGVDCVELAPIKNLREDTIIYKTISKTVKNASVAIPVGFSKESVCESYECVKDAVHPRLQVELPVSTLQMEYTYHMKAEKMLAKISELVGTAHELCSDVEFSALDATRADVDFLVSCAVAAQTAGASLITICDDAGISLPEDIASLVTSLKNAVSIPVYVKVCDNTRMGVASSFAAIAAGADGLKCAMVGEDTVSTGIIADAFGAFASRTNTELSLKNTKIHASIEDMLSKISHEEADTDSGVSEKKKILLDENSTLSQISNAAQILGYDLSETDCGNVQKSLLQVCRKKGAVGYREFEALIAGSAMQAPSTYHLESYTTHSSNITNSMSQVTLRCGEEIICGVSVGDGPIDSAFRAIEQCVGHHYELDDFQVQAVTEGKEALGSALVKLRNNGRLYSGNGISTDIVGSSIRAYINALNKIVAEEA